MTDSESPESAAERFESCFFVPEGGASFGFDTEKTAALIRARDEAVRAEALRPFEELAAKWIDQQAAYPTDAGSVAAAAVRLCARELRALLPPHQPPKSEPGDGEAGGQP